jgi:hypothetical protein
VNGGAFVFELASGSGFADAQILRGPFDNANSATYSATFDWSYIGLGDSDATRSFTFESSYITETGSRYLESFESLSGTKGFNSVTFGNYDSFPPSAIPVPEPANQAMIFFGVFFIGLAVLRHGWLMLKKTV